jgi:hypothetical protein
MLGPAGVRPEGTTLPLQPGTSPAVDAAWQAFAATWDGARVVDAREAGARGDAQAAADCTVAAGSFALHCASDHFTPADVDKVVAVYDAGTDWRGVARPLTTVIRRVTSPRSVELEAAAVTGAAPSTRVVWGTDDTRALQSAVDAVAARFVNNGPGGVVHIPPGHYLVRELALPCARVGTFAQGRCDASYNRIWIRGAGRDATRLENWDVETAAPGLISLGRRAEPGEVDRANLRLQQIAISDLSLAQIPYATRPANVIWSYASEDVWVVNTAGSGHSYECYVMGGGIKSVRWNLHYNTLGPCGHGGPAYHSSSSALNLNGADWVASFNLVTGSLQAVEMGSRRGTLTDNVLIAPQRDAIGVNVGSTSAGIWDNTIARNQIRGFISAIEIFNAIGTVSQTTIVDNTIVDGVVSINSGQETNPVVEGGEAAVVHGATTFSGNTLTYTGYLGNTPIKVGTGAYGPQSGLEVVRVTGNTVTYAAMHLAGGSRNGQACTANAAGGRCQLSGGFLELSDYGGPPDHRGTRPTVLAADNVLRGPAGTVSSGRDIALYRTRAGSLQLLRLKANYDWELIESR